MPTATPRRTSLIGQPSSFAALGVLLAAALAANAAPTITDLGALPSTPHFPSALARDVRKAARTSVELAFVDQGYTGERPAADAKKHRIDLSVVKLPETKRGFVLLPRAGSSNAPSHGWPDSGASPRTTNACQPPSQGSTSSSSPASCSTTSWAEVHGTL